jgi:hypothetical protein
MSDLKDELLLSIQSFTKEKPGILDIVTGVPHRGKSFQALGELANTCESSIKESREMELFIEMTQIFKDTSAKDIALEVGKNVFVGGVDIYRELSAAYTNFFAKQYHQFGVDIGAAFALVFIGPSQVNKLSDDDQNKLKSMIDSQVWPSMDSSIYTDEDNTQYLEVLKYLSDSRAGIAVDEVDVPDVIIETQPEMREPSAEELEDMIDGDYYYEATEVLY